MNDDRDACAVRLALPWLQEWLHLVSEAGQEPALPELQWLVTRARRRRRITSRWREWLLEAAGLGEQVLERIPAGPCVRASFDSTAPDGVWAVAQPVHLATAIDHLRLAPFEDLDLDAAEADALLSTVNGHLAGVGFVLSRGTPGCWMLQCLEHVECTSFEPEAVVGRNIWDFMPGGRDGPAVRSLMNEIQMLLHEHPVNDARQRRGRPTINSLWLWGFGSITRPAPRKLPALSTDDAWLAGLWRLHGAACTAVTEAGRLLERPQAGQLVAMGRPAGGDRQAALAAVDGGILAAARAAVAAGHASNLRVLAGDAVFEEDARSRWRCWRRSVSMASIRA